MTIMLCFGQNDSPEFYESSTPSWTAGFCAASFTLCRIAAWLGFLSVLVLPCVLRRLVQLYKTCIFIICGVYTLASWTFGKMFRHFIEVGVGTERASPQVLLLQCTKGVANGYFSVNPEYECANRENEGVEGEGAGNRDLDHSDASAGRM
jgi:hypothetical protein